MKKFYLIFTCLLLCLGMRAATVEVKTNLWSGTQVMDANWSNWVTIAASNFSDAEEGNVLSVTISEASTTDYAQIMLNDGGWTALVDAEAGKHITDTPTEMKWTVTDNMLAVLKEKGLIVKGVSYTMTSVDLIKKVQTSSISSTRSSATQHRAHGAAPTWHSSRNTIPTRPLRQYSPLQPSAPSPPAQSTTTWLGGE